jgi:MoaA/NifB/PqqE/SkfB family radical SAM enzyme
LNDLKDIGFYTLNDDRVIQVNKDSPMWRCEIILTERCNFSCPYCRGLDAKIYGNRKAKQLTLDEVKYTIDIWCKNKPLKNIRFSGGEPTLYPYIREVIKYAKNKGVDRIAISTNGSNKLSLYKELVGLGVNDFSISLDACCSDDGDRMTGGVKGSFDEVIKNIKELSKLTYVSVGVVFTPKNIKKCIDTIGFAHNLGVSDIRIISSAQWNKPIPRLIEIEQHILDVHPILKYRVNHFINGRNVRGIKDNDSNKCHLMIDDCIVAGNYHFPCVIYMRERGKPIGKVNDNMRAERIDFIEKHDSHKDPICRKNCLDVCIDYNNKYEDLRCKI